MNLDNSNIKLSVELYEKGYQECNIEKKHQLFLKSFQTYNLNLDGLYEIIRYHRLNKNYQQGFDIGKMYLSKYQNCVQIFSYSKDTDIYKFKFLDEMYLCAYYINEYTTAYHIISSLISSECNDENGIESRLSINFNRIGKNLQYVLDKINLNKIPDKIEKLDHILAVKHHTIGIGIPCISRNLKFLKKVLDSIVKQTLKPIEVVISLSNVFIEDIRFFKTILLKYSTIKFKKFITKNKQNASQNRNIILKYFHSQDNFDILSFIDADDEMHSQRLEIISKSFKKYSCDVLLHGYFRQLEPKLPEWFRIRNNIEVKQLLKTTQYIISRGDGRLHHGHVSISKSVKVKQNINFNRGQDYQFIYDNYLKDNKIYHIQLPLSKYVSNLNQEFNKRDIYQLYTSSDLKHLEKRFIKKYNVTNRNRNINKPIVIFGLYYDKDYEFLKNFVGKKYVMFGGTDIDMPKYQKKIKEISQNNNIYFLSISQNIQKRLLQKNIHSEIVTLNLVNKYIFKPPAKLGDYIFIYDGRLWQRNDDTYGKSIFTEVIKRLPEHKFIFSSKLNVQNSDMFNVYSKCFIGLRLTPRDGNANMVQEMEAMKIPVIHNHSEYGIKWKTIDDVIEIIQQKFIIHKKK